MPPWVADQWWMLLLRVGVEPVMSVAVAYFCNLLSELV